MRPLTILLALLIAPILAHAQFTERIRTARPGQAMGGYTVGEHVLQIEHGLNYRHRARTGGAETNFASDVNSVRLGLTEHFEVNGVFGVARVSEDGSGSGRRTFGGVNNTQVGFRYNIVAATDKLPAIAVQTRLLLKAQSSEFRRDKVGTTTIVGVGKGLTPKLGLLLNYGFTYGGGAPGLRSFYAIRPSYALTEDLLLVSDVYGNLNDFDVNLDFGLGYFIGADVRLDAVYALQGLGNFEADGNDLESDWTLGLGVAWRFDWRGEGVVED